MNTLISVMFKLKWIRFLKAEDFFQMDEDFWATIIVTRHQQALF